MVRDNNRKQKQKELTNESNYDIKELTWFLRHTAKCRCTLGSDIREATDISHLCRKSEDGYVCYACATFTRIDVQIINQLATHINE